MPRTLTLTEAADMLKVHVDTGNRAAKGALTPAARAPAAPSTDP